MRFRVVALLAPLLLLRCCPRRAAAPAQRDAGVSPGGRARLLDAGADEGGQAARLHLRRGARLPPGRASRAAVAAVAEHGHRRHRGRPARSGTITRATGRVLFSMGGGDWICSGSVVDGRDATGYRIVLTAGHCVTDTDTGKFATNWLFIPAFDTAPDVHLRARHVRLLDGDALSPDARSPRPAASTTRRSRTTGASRSWRRRQAGRSAASSTRRSAARSRSTQARRRPARR